jgi:hypothetical protein
MLFNFEERLCRVVSILCHSIQPSAERHSELFLCRPCNHSLCRHRFSFLFSFFSPFLTVFSSSPRRPSNSNSTWHGQQTAAPVRISVSVFKSHNLTYLYLDCALNRSVMYYYDKNRVLEKNQLLPDTMCQRLFQFYTTFFLPLGRRCIWVTGRGREKREKRDLSQKRRGFKKQCVCKRIFLGEDGRDTENNIWSSIAFSDPLKSTSHTI